MSPLVLHNPPVLRSPSVGHPRQRGICRDVSPKRATAHSQPCLEIHFSQCEMLAASLRTTSALGVHRASPPAPVSGAAPCTVACAQHGTDHPSASRAGTVHEVNLRYANVEQPGMRPSLRGLHAQRSHGVNSIGISKREGRVTFSAPRIPRNSQLRRHHTEKFRSECRRARRPRSRPAEANSK